MNKERKTALEVVSEQLSLRNKARDIYHLKGELARELGIDMTGFFGMYPNNYQFALLSNLGGRELALMQIILRMTYESMCTEWYFTGTQLKEFSKNFTPKINGRHVIATGNDATMSALGGIKELASRGFFIYEQVAHTSGSKTLHRVQITAKTITLESIADMKQINDGYHFLLGEANYHGLFDEEYSEIGIIEYNHLNKAVKDHKKRGNKLPTIRDGKVQYSPKQESKVDKTPINREYNEPICDDTVPSDRHNTNIRLKTRGKTHSGLDKNDPSNWEYTHETKAGVIIPPELDRSAWVEYVGHRVDIKKKMSPKAQTLMIKKLVAYPKSTQAEAIQNSIMHGWVGVFPESVKEVKSEKEVLI